MACFRGLEEEDFADAKLKGMQSFLYCSTSKVFQNSRSLKIRDTLKIRAKTINLWSGIFNLNAKVKEKGREDEVKYRSAPPVSSPLVLPPPSPTPLPLPLPLPSPQRMGSRGEMSRLNSQRSAEPKPLPPPKQQLATLRPFTWEEVARACNNFSKEFSCRDGGAGPVYATSLCKTDVDITRIASPISKSVRKWVAELRSVARLQHPHLCAVVGFHVHISPAQGKPKPQSEQIVVYERMTNGTLDRLLYSSNAPKSALDWPSRLNIALGAARGLAFLHDLSPVEVAYRSFQTINIQVDRDLNARLSDYCFARNPPKIPGIANRVEAYLAPETLKDGHVFPKSNVWSFGVVLLELLTGRQNMDRQFPEEERNLVTFCRALVEDEKLLDKIMDPQLQGKYPSRIAKRVLDLALHCLQQDVVQRSTMKELVNELRSIDTNSRLVFPKRNS
ncbi:hypothetical protein SUGI_1052130 [Cryptomeria japonica]|nr:hypothetical protein SUGI_1052130 [Cryptomeria japonica]